jgi:hypothetical protein
VAGLNLVSSITLHSQEGSANIDAVVVGYNNSGTEVLGNKFAAYNGRERGSIKLWAEDRVRAVYIWTDSSQLVVKGVMLVLVRGTVLRSSSNLDPAQATVRKDKDGELGCGLLLGMAAAAKPGTEFLSAISFAFLKAPVSVAVTVDMDKIDIEGAEITPKQTLKSTIQGNIDIEASCPEYSETVTYKKVYTRQSAVMAAKARVEALMGASLLTGSVTRIKRSTELVATERRVVPGLGAVFDTWQSPVRGAYRRAQPACRYVRPADWATKVASHVLQVYDIFDDERQLTPEAGRSTTVRSGWTKFVVAKGETVRCSYLYWTRELTTSYTMRATLFFDDEGAAAWAAMSVTGEHKSMCTFGGAPVASASLLSKLICDCPGSYTVNAYTEMVTNITNSKQAGGKAGVQHAANTV